MDFKAKVQSMTADEIIMAMVKALTHPPIINIDMMSFGDYRIVETKYLFGLLQFTRHKCFGCAATNTICEISGKTFVDNNIDSISSRARFIGTNPNFLEKFELAINSLRKGSISGYNYYAHGNGFARIEDVTNAQLPHLGNDYTNGDLIPYMKLANAQKMLQYAE